MKTFCSTTLGAVLEPVGVGSVSGARPGVSEFRCFAAAPAQVRSARAVDGADWQCHALLPDLYRLVPLCFGNGKLADGSPGCGIHAFRQGIKRNANDLTLHVGIASTPGKLGRGEEAMAPVSEIMRIDPAFSTRKHLLGLAYRDPVDQERFGTGLRNAGLPA